MRPAGEAHLAMLQAAHAIRREYADSGRGATLQEMCHRAQVGYKVARALVPKLKERGQLQVVGERKVDYRNRPVAEYAPVDPKADKTDDDSAPGMVVLSHCMADWVR
jgi:hypothetical protein